MRSRIILLAFISSSFIAIFAQQAQNYQNSGYPDYPNNNNGYNSQQGSAVQNVGNQIRQGAQNVGTQIRQGAQNVGTQLRQGIQTTGNVARNALQTAANFTYNKINQGLVSPGANYVNASYPGVGIPPVTSGVWVSVQLQSYTDQNYRLSPSTLCVCPQGQNYDTCVRASPFGSTHKCFFSFLVIISSADPYPRYDSTPFVRVDQNFQVNDQDRSLFMKQMEFVVEKQPVSIAVLVHHLGSVIDATTGSLIEYATVVPVDTFLLTFDNNTQYGTKQNAQLTGQDLQTSLTLTYSVSCRGTLTGPGCNLQCNQSSANAQIAVCRDAGTNYYSICRYQSQNAVSQCQPCPWGIKDNSYCMDENGGILDLEAELGLVPSSYKTATVVLAVVAGLLFLFLMICLLVSLCIQRRNGKAANSSTPPGYNSRTAQNQGGYSGGPEAVPLHAGNLPPRAPRNGSAANARPNRPALRQPTYQSPPAAHLGGAEPLNDTISLSGSQVPNLNVSRSADV